jgi:outer membrane autotransporter protein
VTLDTDDLDDPTWNPRRPQLWSEFTAGHERARSDRNAHGFTINRHGIALGVDWRFSERLAAGVSFRYTNPRLRQATGRVDADDFEFGLYGMTRLADNWEMKLYSGYSRQRYRLDRAVTLPALPSANIDAFRERLHGRASGDALAASVEVIRTVEWHDARFLPTLALDFEKAWMRGFRESGGTTALDYDSTSMSRVAVRFGVDGVFRLPRGVDLKARVQYAVQVNSSAHPATGVRFARGAPEQRTADIWGVRIGRGYWNPGLGLDWNVGGPRGDKSLYLNYDARLHRRASSHALEAGFLKRW